MEATVSEKDETREVTRVTVHIDKRLARRLWNRRGNTGQTLSDTVETALLKLFEGEKPPTAI